MGVSLDASDRRGKNGQSLWALVLVARDVVVSEERYRSFSSRPPLPEHRLEGAKSKSSNVLFPLHSIALGRDPPLNARASAAPHPLPRALMPWAWAVKADGESGTRHVWHGQGCGSESSMGRPTGKRAVGMA